MILILSQKSDFSTGKVEKWLNYYGANYLRVNDEECFDIIKEVKISSSETEITFTINNTINNTIIKLKDINVIWNRRGIVNLNYPQLTEDFIKTERPLVNSIINNIDDEYKTLQSYIYYKIKQIPSINDPREYNINKLIVLDEAKQSGFSIPNTTISKDPFCHVQEGNSYVCKNIQDCFSYRSEKYSMGQQTFSFDPSLQVSYLGYSLIQEKVKAKYEIRTFALFEQLYSVAIITEKKTTDHRNEIQDSSTRIVPIKLDIDISNKIHKLLKKLSLESGSIDIMVSERDEYFFLEVNPVGQFDYVSELGGYNIEQKIAQKLIEY